MQHVVRQDLLWHGNKTCNHGTKNVTGLLASLQHILVVLQIFEHVDMVRTDILTTHLLVSVQHILHILSAYHILLQTFEHVDMMPADILPTFRFPADL